MQGNDRSGTVDANLSLYKAVELAFTGGYDLVPFTDPMTGKQEPRRRFGPDTGDPRTFASFEDFGTHTRSRPDLSSGKWWMYMK